MNRRKRLGGGQGGHDIPAGYRNALRGRQYFLAQRIDGNAGTLVARNEAIDQRIDAGGGEGLHDTTLVGGSDHQPVLRGDKQIAPRPAVGAIRDLVDEVGLVQVDHPHQGANHLAPGITNGYRNGENRCVQHLAHDRFADPGFPLPERGGDVIPVHEIDAHPFHRERHRGYRSAIGPGDVGPRIERGLENQALLQECLQGSRTGEHGRADSSGNRIQHFHPFVQRLFHIGGHQGHHRELLFA